MLWEAWQYFRTPVVQPYIKKMGFLHESIAMAARAKRCQEQWFSHYAHCQTVIESAIPKCPQHRKALIIGAGSLQDVPLEALSNAFEEVFLVDLVFLPAARNNVSAFANIHLVEADVTNSLEDIFSNHPMVQSPQLFLEQSQTVDLVVSLNLITQLPLLPTKWLYQRQLVNAQQADELGQTIIREHLEYLQKFSGVVCLIADRLSSEFNALMKQVDSLDPWWGVESPHYEQSWDWELIPSGEGKSGFSQIHKVGVSWL